MGTAIILIILLLLQGSGVGTTIILIIQLLLCVISVFQHHLLLGLRLCPNRDMRSAVSVSKGFRVCCEDQRETGTYSESTQVLTRKNFNIRTFF